MWEDHRLTLQWCVLRSISHNVAGLPAHNHHYLSLWEIMQGLNLWHPNWVWTKRDHNGLKQRQIKHIQLSNRDSSSNSKPFGEKSYGCPRSIVSIQWQAHRLQGSTEIRPPEDWVGSCFWPRSHWQAVHRNNLLSLIMPFLLLLSTHWVQCHHRKGERTRSRKYPLGTSALIGTDIFSKRLSVKSESRGMPL